MINTEVGSYTTRGDLTVLVRLSEVLNTMEKGLDNGLFSPAARPAVVDEIFTLRRRLGRSPIPAGGVS